LLPFIGFPYSGGPNFGGGGQNFGGMPNFSNGSNFNSQLQSFNANNNGTGSGYGSMSYPPPGMPNAQYPPPGAPPTDGWFKLYKIIVLKISKVGMCR